MESFPQQHMETQDQSIELLPIQVTLFIDVAVIITFSAFLLSFLKTCEKNYGLLMILILTLSDLGYPIMNILTTIWHKYNLDINVLGPFALSVNGFNLYWTAALAVYTHLLFDSIKNYKAFHYKRFICSAFLICLAFSLALPLSVALGAWKGKIDIFIRGGYSIGYRLLGKDGNLAYFIARDVVGKIIPLSATSFYYWKVYKAMQKASIFFCAPKNNSLRLFWLSMIPIVCTLPGILSDTFRLFSYELNTHFITIPIFFLRYIWEVLNLWIYWSLQQGDRKGSMMMENIPIEYLSTDDEDNFSKKKLLESMEL